MPRTTDFTQVARRVLDQVTGEQSEVFADDGQAHARAVETGRKGGLKGGKARAAKLTPDQRSESARIAANARWGAENDEVRG